MTPPGYVPDSQTFVDDQEPEWKGTSAEIEVLRSLGVMVSGTLNIQWNVRSPDDPNYYPWYGKLLPYCWFNIKMVLPPTSWQRFVMNLLIARTVITLAIYILGLASIVAGIVLMFHPQTYK